MNKHNRKISRPIRIGLSFIIAVALIIVFVPLLNNVIHPIKYIASSENTLTVSIPYIINGEVDETTLEIPRGTQVHISEKGAETSQIKYKGQLVSIPNENLVDSLENCVQIENIYPRRLINLREKKGGKLSDEVVTKGEKVKVLKVDPQDLDTTTGNVKWYQVEKEGKEYYLSGQYVETNKELALTDYSSSISYSTYWDAYYGENYSKDAYIDQIDYKPQEVPNYENNPLREDINAVHVSLEKLVENKDYYMNLNDTTGINSLAIEIKGDGGSIFYDSDVPEDYLSNPSEATSSSLMSKDELSSLFKELQDDGFYVIARVVTFKDAIFASQNPDDSFTDQNGNLVLHNDEYWPSAFSRKAWSYNVDIAKEIAQCNVNEIQFDYVRFPDGTLSKALDGTIDLHNTYNESKTSALQGFLIYAKEELAQYEVYVAADIFAWPVVAQDDQDIGQFLPAIANIVDIVSPMPYTDHFSMGAMGIDDPTANPEETLYQFSLITKKTLDSIETPAIYRTWIQGYGDFGPDEMVAQINGIKKAGYQGYMVWAGSGDQEILDPRKDGFIDSAS